MIMANGSCAPCAAVPNATGQWPCSGGIVSNFAARPSPPNGRTHNCVSVIPTRRILSAKCQLELYKRAGVTTKMVRQNSRLLVVCGPSGSGKSTLLRKLFDEYPDKFGFSVSHTTRSPRRFEVDGQHYHFTTKDQMQAAIERGDFLEHAIFSNNMYGTSLKAVQNVQKSGKICVLDIDMQGVIQIKKVTSLKPVCVFVKPPSIGELEVRLRRRNSESEDNLRARLNVAQQEINYGETPGNFDCIIINESLDKAYNVFKEFVLKSFENVEN